MDRRLDRGRFFCATRGRCSCIIAVGDGSPEETASMCDSARDFGSVYDALMDAVYGLVSGNKLCDVIVCNVIDGALGLCYCGKGK